MADTKISELTAASALDGTELVHVVQSGASKMATTQDLMSFALQSNSTRNLIINGDGVIAQRTIGTPINDDSYSFDRWIVLSDGNGVVTPSQETIGGDRPAGSRSAMKLTVAVANKKFGLLQIVEAANCQHLIASVASLSAKAKSSGLTNLRIAILSWTGTADTVTSDVVSTWNAVGVDPTLVANWTYENVPTSLALSASWDSFSIENISVDTAGTKQVAAFIWVDDTDAAVSDYLLLSDVQLEHGAVATAFERRPLADEHILCRFRYAAGGALFSGDVTSGGIYHVRVVLPERMAYAPSVTATDTANNGFAAGNPQVNAATDTYLAFQKTANATVPGGIYSFTWTASAEL